MRLNSILAVLALGLGPWTARAVETWYVDDALGKDDGTYDGKSAATPFKTIGKAIASTTPTDASQTSSPAGDTIWIADGTYYIDETLTSENSFRLLSISGDRTKVIVDAQGKCPCLRLPTTGVNGNHSRTWKICGITFRNGFSDQSDTWETENNRGDVSCSAAGLGLGAVAMVSNCVVESCHRDVSAATEGTTSLFLEGGGIAMRGYSHRPSIGKSFSANWGDVTPGIYDTVVTNCSLYGHVTRTGSVSAEGGGIWCSYSPVSNVLVACCSVSNASAAASSTKTGGGGIFARPGSRVVDCIVRKCRSARVPGTTGWAADGFFGSAGGVYMDCSQDDNSIPYDTDVIHDCLVEENETIGAAAGGLLASAARVINCTIRTNHLIATRSPTSYFGGTGVKLTGIRTSITGCRIEGNDAPDLYGFASGGGLELQSTTRAQVTDTLVCNNTGAQRGGLSLCYNTTEAFVSNVVVVGNVSTNQHCAISCVSTANSLLLTDSIFVGNRGGTENGTQPHNVGVVCLGSSNNGYSNVVFRNTLFLNNETVGSRGWLIGGDYGSATRATGWKPLTFENCSFVGNTNRTGWGTMQAVYFGGDTTTDLFRMKGCVIARNSYATPNQGNKAGFSPAAAAGDVTYSYCDARTQGDAACVKIPVSAENHNLDYDTDPKFVDAENGDYRLAADSPLVDAGGPANTWESWMGTGSRRSAQDVGNGCFEVSPVGKWGVSVVRTETVPRRCGTAIDMGCFEYYIASGLLLIFR